MCSHDDIKAKKHAMDDNINDMIISKPRDFDIFSNVAYLFANLIKSHEFAQCAYITCPGMQKKDTISSQCTVKMYLSPIPIPFLLLFVLTMTSIALHADGFICFSFESQSAKIILLTASG